MNRTGRPIIVSTDPPRPRSQTGSAAPVVIKDLPRLSFGSKAAYETQQIEEYWLQSVLDQAPGILPIENIDERVEPPLMSLGREIDTPSGPIDNLFIGRNGHLVIVETKLWRNPEARRKVVAQILDYAVHVRRWDYSKVEQLWKARQKGSIWNPNQDEESSEHEWIDRVNENLSKGRITLLIVGDGIQTQAQQLGEALAGHPDVLFRLAFVELQLFQLDPGRVLVLPITVSRTTEIERAVVRIEYVQQTPPTVSVTTPAPDSATKRPLTQEALLAAIRESDSDGPARAETLNRLITQLQDTDAEIHWTSAGFSLKLLDPSGKGINFVLGGVNRPRIFYAIPATLAEQLRRSGWGEDVIKEITAAQVALLERLGARRTAGGDQFNIDLLKIQGREREFVDGLRQLGRFIQTESLKQAV